MLIPLSTRISPLVKPLHICVFLLTLASPPIAAAPTSDLDPIIVNNDDGGLLLPRGDLINKYIREGREVRIVGRYCNSACTMFLAVPNLCVSSRTRFGFHGPSWYGFIPAEGYAFEAGSLFMARHYPEPIRSWYIEHARFIQSGYKFLTGAELIRHGIRSC